MSAVLVVVRIEDRYGVVVSDNLMRADLAALFATFESEEEARRCAAWLATLRRAYHGARPAYL